MPSPRSAWPGNPGSSRRKASVLDVEDRDLVAELRERAPRGPAPTRPQPMMTRAHRQIPPSGPVSRRRRRRRARGRRRRGRARSSGHMGSCVPSRNHPRNACGMAGPTMTASASRETASSTSAAPMSRAWSSWRAHLDVGLLGRTLGEVEHPRGLLPARPHVVIQVVLPVDLHDVDGDRARCRRPCASSQPRSMTSASVGPPLRPRTARETGRRHVHRARRQTSTGAGAIHRPSRMARPRDVSGAAPLELIRPASCDGAPSRRGRPRRPCRVARRGRASGAWRSGCTAAGPTSGWARTRAGRRW